MVQDELINSGKWLEEVTGWFAFDFYWYEVGITVWMSAG